MKRAGGHGDRGCSLVANLQRKTISKRTMEQGAGRTEFIAIGHTHTVDRHAPAIWGCNCVLDVGAATASLDSNAVCDKLIVDNLINSASIRQRFASRQ